MLMNVMPQSTHVMPQLVAPIMLEVLFASVIQDIQEMEQYVQMLMSA